MSTKYKSDLIGQRQMRIEKIAKMRKLGIDPYPNKGTRTHSNKDIIENFKDIDGHNVSVVGRVMLSRDHGNLMFMKLRDTTGDIQLYIKLDELNDNLSTGSLDFIDSGDHIQADGKVTKTKSGEISVLVKDITMLSKALRPLPTKFGGLEDKELRYRRRYLDMTLNPEVRKMFERRAQFWKAVREFMDNDGFYEVNIPVLEDTTGGADAKPFETYFDALSERKYLRISHELPLKRLLGAGFEKVYDLGPRFRNEGYSDEHLPEHIAMEWYWAYANYEQGMDLTEQLFKFVLKRVYGTLQFESRGFNVDLSKEWKRVDMTDLIKETHGVDILEDETEVLLKKLLEINPEIENTENRSRIADGLWKTIRPTVEGPIILTGVPKYLSPLSKEMKSDPRKTERFHPVIAGSELANAFSELNDPQDQLKRFVEQQNLRETGDSEAHMMDIDFVEMLEYGMPPAVGYGMSERVFWFFENVTAKEGVPFPPMRYEFSNKTKEIYGDVFDFDSAEKDTKKKPFNAKSQTPTGKQDLTRKFVLILDKDLEGWKLTNTIGHLSAYLGNKLDSDIVSRLYFPTKDEINLPADSQFPIVALCAKQTQIHNTLKKVMENDNLKYMAFTEEMVTYNLDTEVADAMGNKNLDELQIYGIGLFGDNKDIDALTKKYSLWK